MTPSRGPRLPTLLSDDARRRAALVAHLLLPGVPHLYYGEEIDLPDAVGADPELASLAPMAWDSSRAAGFTTGRPWMEPDESYLHGRNVEAELADGRSLLRLVKALSDLRVESRAAAFGAWAPVRTAPGGVLAWTRSEGDEVVLVAINTGPTARVRLAAPGDWVDLTDGLAPVSCAPACALGLLLPGGYRILARGVPTPHPIPPGEG